MRRLGILWVAVLTIGILVVGMASEATPHARAQADAREATPPATPTSGPTEQSPPITFTANAYTFTVGKGGDRFDVGADGGSQSPGIGSGPGHGDRAGPHAARGRSPRLTDQTITGLTAGPVASRSPAWSAEDRAGPVRDQAAGSRRPGCPVPQPGPERSPKGVHGTADRTPTTAEISQACLITSRLTATGKPVSRRALRSEGIKGSNQALNALDRRINAELADAGHSRPRLRTLHCDA